MLTMTTNFVLLFFSRSLCRCVCLSSSVFWIQFDVSMFRSNRYTFRYSRRKNIQYFLYTSYSNRTHRMFIFINGSCVIIECRSTMVNINREDTFLRTEEQAQKNRALFCFWICLWICNINIDYRFKWRKSDETKQHDRILIERYFVIDSVEFVSTASDSNKCSGNFSRSEVKRISSYRCYCIVMWFKNRNLSRYFYAFLHSTFVNRLFYTEWFTDYVTVWNNAPTEFHSFWSFFLPKQTWFVRSACCIELTILATIKRDERTKQRTRKKYIMELIELCLLCVAHFSSGSLVFHLKC